MNNRAILTTLLVACVVLAGCSGAPAGSTDGDPTETPTATPADDAAAGTTTPTATRTLASLNATTLADDHRRTLTEASFESRLSFAVHLPNGTAGIEERTAVDRDGGLALSDQTMTVVEDGGTTNVTTTRFTRLGDGTTYERLTGAEHATVYSTNDGEGTSTEPVDVSDVGGDLVGAAASVEWERVGTETVDGVTATRYEASGADSVEQFRDETAFGESALNRVETTTGANATLLVGEDGVVRQFSLSIEGTTDGEPVTVSLDVRFAHVGSTTVETPAWLDEAKANA